MLFFKALNDPQTLYKLEQRLENSQQFKTLARIVANIILRSKWEIKQIKNNQDNQLQAAAKDGINRIKEEVKKFRK